MRIRGLLMLVISGHIPLFLTPAKLARCATARKLLHIAWAVVTKKQDFDPEYHARARRPKGDVPASGGESPDGHGDGRAGGVATMV
jgi:hypothetical protein